MQHINTHSNRECYRHNRLDIGIDTRERRWQMAQRVVLQKIGEIGWYHKHEERREKDMWSHRRDVNLEDIIYAYRQHHKERRAVDPPHNRRNTILA